MQARAIFEAAAEVQKSGIKVHPEIMIPLVGFQERTRIASGDRASRRAGSAGGEKSEIQLSGRDND